MPKVGKKNYPYTKTGKAAAKKAAKKKRKQYLMGNFMTGLLNRLLTTQLQTTTAINDNTKPLEDLTNYIRTRDEIQHEYIPSLPEHPRR